LDDFRQRIGIGCHGVAGLTLYKRGRERIPGNVCSSAIAVILRDGFVPAEKVGNLMCGQCVNIFRTHCVLRDIHWEAVASVSENSLAARLSAVVRQAFTVKL